MKIPIIRIVPATSVVRKYWDDFKIRVKQYFIGEYHCNGRINLVEKRLNEQNGKAEEQNVV